MRVTKQTLVLAESPQTRVFVDFLTLLRTQQ
jgi:hypothetical protein